MTISDYETLTGTTVPTAQEPLYTAIIAKTKLMLEMILGYTLDPVTLAETRYYDLNVNDPYILLDPYKTITSIEIMKGAEVVDTLVLGDDYSTYTKNGISKYIQLITCMNLQLPRYPFLCCNKPTDYRLKVVGIFEFATVPQDISMIWADMITYYVDPNRDLKSQTLGSHSYTRGNMTPPEQDKANTQVTMKYAGSNGMISYTRVI
jgi:hypothetical protein